MTITFKEAIKHCQLDLTSMTSLFNAVKEILLARWMILEKYQFRRRCSAFNQIYCGHIQRFGLITDQSYIKLLNLNLLILSTHKFPSIRCGDSVFRKMID